MQDTKRSHQSVDVDAGFTSKTPSLFCFGRVHPNPLGLELCVEMTIDDTNGVREWLKPFSPQVNLPSIFPKNCSRSMVESTQVCPSAFLQSAKKTYLGSIKFLALIFLGRANSVLQTSMPNFDQNAELVGVRNPDKTCDRRYGWRWRWLKKRQAQGYILQAEYLGGAKGASIGGFLNGVFPETGWPQTENHRTFLAFQRSVIINLSSLWSHRSLATGD